MFKYALRVLPAETRLTVYRRLRVLTKIIKILCFRVLSGIILGRFLRLENMFLNRFNLPETTKNIDKHQNFDIPKRIPNLG